MISTMSTGGHTQHNYKEYVVDTPTDIDNLPIEGIPMGSTAFVISTSEVYMLSGKHTWEKI